MILVTPDKKAPKTTSRAGLTLNRFMSMVSRLWRGAEPDPRRDINAECGYPEQITIDQYRYSFERNGIATRVVSVFPDECWALQPEVVETDEAVETPFEKAWKEFDTQVSAIHYLHRVDVISGIGNYGLLFIGFDDLVPGDLLTKPATPAPGRKVLFLRAFDQSQVQIAEWETDMTSPRYGQPKHYNITFADSRTDEPGGIGVDHTQRRVHWSRVLHVADNRLSSDFFGMPRQMNVYDRLCDLRKALGGSAEMLWRAGFPGLSLETDPSLGDVELSADDEAFTRKQAEEYSNSLSRILLLKGMTAKNLGGNVTSPEYHIQVQLQAIAITIKCPLRILIGTEESKLSSTQDSKTWNKRLKLRQDKYIEPMLFRPFIDRMIQMGVLAPPAAPSGYTIRWSDLNSPTDQDRAEVASKITEAMAKYVAGAVDQLCPPLEYLTLVLGFTTVQAQVIINAGEEYVSVFKDMNQPVQTNV